MLTGASRGRVLAEKGTWENFCGDEMFEMFYTMSVVLVTQLYTFIKTQTFHLNWLSFIVFKLYNAINLIKFFSTGEVEENHHSFFFFFYKRKTILFHCNIIQVLQTSGLEGKSFHILWVTNWWWGEGRTGTKV